MAKYNTPYKWVLEGIQDAIDMGYLSEDRSDWWLQCSWHINGEDIICFFETLQMLGMDVFSRMAAIPVVVEYTDGEEERQVEELGFEGGYKISAEGLTPIYIGWFGGTGADAKELVPTTGLSIKDSVTSFTESKSKKAKKEARRSRDTIWSPIRIKKEILECIEDWGDNLEEYKPPIVSGDRKEASAAFVFHGVKIKAKFDFFRNYYEMEDEEEEFDAFEGSVQEFSGDLDELLADIAMKDGPVK